jgi:RNA polymerase sigma factor (sigma-70 family)
MGATQLRTGNGTDRWLAADVTADLMRTAQAGGAQELDRMLRELRPLLYTYFSHRVDAAAADDLAQRALLIVAREYRRITPDGAARWLVTVARNVVRDEFRRTTRAAGRQVPAHDAYTLPAPDATASQLEYRELVDAIVGAAHTTCPASLRPVVLGIVRGLDVSEIARELGVSEPTVRVRLTRARAFLRRELRLFHVDARPQSFALHRGARGLTPT